MSAAGARPHQVLVVDADARVRRALTELIEATDGFTVAAAVADPGEVPTPEGGTAPAAAVVGIHPADPAVGLAHVRALADRLPTVAVATAASLRPATAAAGAAAFCEMDGNAERLIAALHTAAHQPAGCAPSHAHTDTGTDNAQEEYVTTSTHNPGFITGSATFRVDGMTCDHCRHAVTTEVSAIPGIRNVDVDLAGGSVTLFADQPIDRAEIAAAVDEAGYTLRA